MTADPYVQPIPQWVYQQNDDELRAWYEYDNRWKHDIWAQLGGGDDILNEAQEFRHLSQNVQLRPIMDDLKKRLDELEQVVPVSFSHYIDSISKSINDIAQIAYFIQSQNGLNLSRIADLEKRIENLEQTV